MLELDDSANLVLNLKTEAVLKIGGGDASHDYLSNTERQSAPYRQFKSIHVSWFPTVKYARKHDVLQACFDVSSR